MNSKLVLYALFSVSFYLQAEKLVIGDNGTETTFTQPVASWVLHKPTKTLFVGLQANADFYAFSKANLNTPNGTPHFELAWKTDSTVGTTKDNLIKLLALSDNENAITQPRIIYSNNTIATLYSGSYNGTVFSQTKTDGAASVINDASGTTGCSNIMSIAANKTHVVALVKAAAGANPTIFGVEANDGVAIMEIDPTSLDLNLKNAVDGGDGNKAFGITNTLAQIKIGANNPTFTAFPTAGNPPIIWDETLQRFYIGLSGTTGAATGDGLYGIIIGTINPNDTTFSLLTPCNNAAIADNSRIVAAYNEANVAKTIAISKLAVMHTSTGFSYLIVQGGNATNTNSCYAVALVTDAVNPTINGTFAQNNDPSTQVDFKTQAADNDDLPSIANNAHLLFTNIGTGGAANLPFAANDPLDKAITDMQVEGDTVFVSCTSDVVDANNAPGIYYSQAIFNHLGKIVRWTDWAKAAPFTLGNSETDGSCNNIVVDATTGALWALDTDGTTVKKTSWTETGKTENSLIAQLNKNLSDGCYSFLDINKAQQNVGNALTHYYALFGGNGKIIFTQINSTAAHNLQDPQNTVTTDFSLPAHFLVTQLPQDTAPVTCLGYSKSVTADANFFYAGTKNGLYVWAKTADGTGSSTDDFSDLDETPFTNAYSWQKLTAVIGQPYKIKSSGSGLYVLTRDISNDNTAFDRLYRFDNTQTTVTLLNTLNTGHFLVARAQTNALNSNLTNALCFYDFEILLQANLTKEQILLATNNGLYLSTKANGSNTATSQAESLWSLIAENPNTTGIIYDHLTGVKNCRNNTTCIATPRTKLYELTNSYNTSILQQLGLSATGTVGAKTATTVNAKPLTGFENLNAATALFSDGARRFYSGIPQDGDGRQSTLFVLPYNTASDSWNIIGQSIQEIQDTVITEKERFYWIETVGATGSIMVGTNSGIVSLE